MAGIDLMANTHADRYPTEGEKQAIFETEETTKPHVTTTADDDAASNTSIKKEPEVHEEEEENLTFDPYVPFDGLPDESGRRLVTLRALFIGCICGAAVNASNVYLGLKTGWTFSANLLGAIVGFAVLKSLAKALPSGFPILGGDFGPRENNIVQTVATASGGLSSVFISGIPAMYRLGLLTTPGQDFARLITLTITAGYFGFAMATPLRKFFIIYVARELRLVFPTPSATSMTIRSMHLAATGETIAKLKMKALGIAFSVSIILRVVSQYATGILWDWHVFTWFFIWSGYKGHAIDVENWQWYIEFTPAFIGSGIIVGLNTAFSFLAGSVLAWGIIGPTLVKYGVAFGSPLFAEGDPGYDKWKDYINYASLSKKFSTKDHPSPRFWMLWPGVLAMIAISFTELALQWKVFWFVIKAVRRAGAKFIVDMGAKRGKSFPRLEKNANQKEEDIVEDPARPEELVKVWMWLPLLIITIIATCVVLGVQFDMPVGMSLLSLFLAFFFSLLAIQCTGVTDITPLTAASKASQLVLGGATKGEHWATEQAQRLNLLGGSIASMGANQASDLVGDFRVGFLLRTPPNSQWIAQALGTIVAVFLAPAMFVLFSKAYPCIIDTSIETCPFTAPSVSAWQATAVAVTDPTFPVPKSSGIFAICWSIFGCAMICIRHYAYTGKWEKYRVYHPNMMVMSLAFVLPQTQYGTAMVMGAVPAWYIQKKYPKWFDLYAYAIAAGMISGEGIGGVVNAVFQIAGISGPTPYGTNVACPGDSC